MAKVLVVYAHPTYDLSRMNKALVKQIDGLDNVVISNLYSKYPDKKINATEEQQLIVPSDLIILQFPFYWFNTTPLMKAWLDEVLLDGFAYGTRGNKITGKQLICCITIGSSKERYSNDLGFTLNDLLKPFEATARYCGMIYNKPFVVPNYNADTASLDINDKNLQHHANEYKNFLANYTINGNIALNDSYPSY